MLKQKLISSVQAGPFSEQNRIVDIDIAEGQVVNMAESFIVLTTRILNAPNSIVNLCPSVIAEPHYTPFNLDFVRNASLTGSKCGQLENVRRCNALNHNMIELSKSQAEKQSQVISLYQVRDNATSQLLSPYVDFKKQGEIPSSYRDVKLRVKMTDLFSLGNQTIDTSLTGTLRVHLELENGFGISLTNTPMFQGVANEGVLENVASGDTFVVFEQFPTAQDSPYTVGMEYSLTYTDAAVPPNVVVETVTVIQAEYDTSNGALTLTLEGDNLPLEDQGAPKQYTQIKLSEIPDQPAPAPMLQVALVEMNVAEVLGEKPEKINELQYTTFTTEEFNTGNQQFVSKAFNIEPTCVNVFVMFVGSKGTLLSNNTDVESYRLRCNEVDIYDRDINVNSINGNPAFNMCYFDDTLHLDSNMRTFINAGIPYKNYAGVAMSRDSQSNVIHLNLDNNKYGISSNRLLVLSAPTPITPNTKILQVNINCKSGKTVDNIILFKQCIKAVSFK